MITMSYLIREVQKNEIQAEYEAGWGPAVPCRLWTWRGRIKDAWLVLTGKAEALVLK